MENLAITVCAILGLRFIQKGHLSFGLNLWVEPNDSCVEVTHTHDMA